jgi:hypothetical protein
MCVLGLCLLTRTLNVKMLLWMLSNPIKIVGSSWKEAAFHAFES